MRIGNHKEYPTWFHGHLRTICASLATFLAMLIVSYIVISPMTINYYGDAILFLQSISFWVSLQRVCRPAVDRSRRKCFPRWWLPVFDVCVGNLWSAYILMQCYYPVENITVDANTECTPTELATYVSATIFMFLSAFCHYQTHMMLEESRPLRRHRGAHIDEIVASALLYDEQQPISDEIADYGSWDHYGVVDEKDVTGEGQEGASTEFGANQVEGIKNEETKGVSTSSSATTTTTSSNSSPNSSSGYSSSSISSIKNSKNQSPQSVGPAGEGICPICMDKPQNAVCIPCGHTAGCFACLLRNQREKHICPICRGRVKQVVKLHRV